MIPPPEASWGQKEIVVVESVPVGPEAVRVRVLTQPADLPDHAVALILRTAAEVLESGRTPGVTSTGITVWIEDE